MSSCASTKKDEAPVEVEARTAEVLNSSPAPYSQAVAETVDSVKTGASDEDRRKVFKGTGIMVKGQGQGGSVPPPQVTPTRGGNNVVLNFEAADLREVIRNMLGEILGEAYLIDPTVNGQVTIRTTSGIPRDDLHATLETLLRMNNATMIKENGIYKILPAALGPKGHLPPQLGGSQRPLPKGYSIQVVPLRYVGAEEMHKILEPFARDAQALRPDKTRNLMVLSGTELELRHLLDTIEMFDIDWMAGMSIGIFKLKNVEVKGLTQDIQTMFAAETAGMLGAMKFIPIERMNAIMVVAPQPEQLDTIKELITKFDEDGSGDTPRLYVYNLKYARADKLAPLLQQAFTGKNTASGRAQPATLAPGSSAVRMGGGLPGMSSSTTGMRSTAQTNLSRTPQQTAMSQTTARPTIPAGGIRPGAVLGGGMGIAQDIQVVADEDNNAVLIVATPTEYALVEQALKKLDVPQRQVVIEVTMAEVTLSDIGDIGSKWWFTNNSGVHNTFGRDGTLTSSTRTGSYGGLGSPVPPADVGSLGGEAFNLIIDPKRLNAIITAQGSASNVKVVANPHIAALDNQEATIQVTNPTPILTTSYGGGYSEVQTQNYTYIEPGVIVRVKPRINDGGNVSMEAEIEFSAIAGEPPGGGTAPPLLKRSISSQLMVPSGSTMVIGGLIRDDKTSGSEGVPFLSQIPVLGMLFGKQNWNKARTELVIFLTPRVVENDETRRAIIKDMRERMDNLEGLLQESKVLPTDLMKREGFVETQKGAEATKKAEDDAQKEQDEAMLAKQAEEAQKARDEAAALAKKTEEARKAQDEAEFMKKVDEEQKAREAADMARKAEEAEVLRLAGEAQKAREAADVAKKTEEAEGLKQAQELARRAEEARNARGAADPARHAEDIVNAVKKAQDAQKAEETAKAAQQQDKALALENRRRENLRRQQEEAEAWERAEVAKRQKAEGGR